MIRRIPVATIALFGIVGAFATMMFKFYVPAYSYEDADADAFFHAAKGLAERGDPAQRTADPFEFVGEQMVEAREGVYYSKYPIGYSLLCAIAYAIGGPTAPFAVNPLVAVLTIVGMYLVGAALSGSRAIGVCAAAVLAANPVHIIFGLSALSHTLSMCVATWGMLFAWRWVSAGGFVNSALAGALIAFGPTIRYADALLVLPLLAMIAWRLAASSNRGRTMREVLGMALAGITVMTPQLAYQQLAFGSIWINGYAFSRESTAFSWSWFAQHVPMIVKHLWTAGLLPLFVIGVLGLFYLAVVDRRRALFLGLWASPLALLYCSYYFITPDRYLENLRYFLNVFPPLVVSGLLLASAIRWPVAWARVVAIGLVLLVTIPSHLRRTGELLGMQRDALRASQRLQEQIWDAVPADSVIVVADPIVYFLEYDGRYRLYDMRHLNDPNFVEWANNVLASTTPSPVQRPRFEKLIRQVAGKSPDALAAMQLDIVNQHLRQGRKVVLLSLRESPDALRPFKNELQVGKLRRFSMDIMPTTDQLPGAAGSATITLYALSQQDV